MDLSIIIINWNSAIYVQACLTSVFANPPPCEFEIIVLDNGSYDTCGEMIRELHSRVIFIQSPNNVGFGIANNLASERAHGHHLLFLNPDTVVNSGSLGALYESGILLDRCGIVGALLLNSDGSIQTSCVQSFPTITNQICDTEFLRRLFPSSSLWGTASLYSESKDPSQVEAISGACMLVKREVFDRIGRFSTDYFMYSEDIDLCYKAAHSGFQNYFDPKATIVHFGGGSSNDSQTHFYDVLMRDARWHFFLKFRGLVYSLTFRIILGLAATVRSALASVAVLSALESARRIRFISSARKWRAIMGWAFFNHRPVLSKRSA